MSNESNEQPDLHIETDWKTEARAEKERLAKEQREQDSGSEGGVHADTDWKAQARAEKEQLSQKAKEDDKQQPEGGQSNLPPADFRTLISQIATQAMLSMGAIPDPQTGQRTVSLELAKHHTDMLGVVEEKTKGNLTDEESQMLSQVLYELRMQYLELSKQATQQTAGQGGPEAAGPVTGEPRGPQL